MPATLDLTLTDDLRATPTLAATDVETAAAGLTFTVTSLPAVGTLRTTGGVLVQVGDTFTGSPASLVYELGQLVGTTDGAVVASFTYTVTDTGDNGDALLTSAPATVTLRAPANSTGVLRVVGTDAADTIVVSKFGTNQVRVTVNGAVKGTYPIASLTGVRVFGRGGDDTLSATDSLTGLTEVRLDGGTGTDAVALVGTTAADTFRVTDAGIVFGSLLVTPVDAESVTVDGGAGTDTLVGGDAGSAWRVTGANAGTLDSLAFRNVENLTGGAGDDTFALAGGTLTGKIDGGLGADMFVADNGANAWTLSTGATLNKVTGLTGATGGFTGIERLVGGSGTDTFTLGGTTGVFNLAIDGGAGANALVGRNVATTWAVNGPDAGSISTQGVSFARVGSLTGGTAADTFALTDGGSLSGTLNGGAGTDTLVGGDAGYAWAVTGANAGTVAGVTNYTGIKNLTGGAGADTFTLSTGSVAGSVTGGGGNDLFVLGGATVEGKLDGGAGTNSIRGSDAGNSFGISGLDAGTVTSVAGGFVNVQNLIGGNTGTSFAFTTATAQLTGSITGNGGSDTSPACRRRRTGW